MCLSHFASSCVHMMTWGILSPTSLLTGSDTLAWMNAYDSWDEGKPPTLQFSAGESCCPSECYILCIHESQQNPLLLRHIQRQDDQRVLSFLLCQSDKAGLALFVPLPGQFAMCDLSEGNLTWQETLKSDDHLQVSGDVGHSYSFTFPQFVINIWTFPVHLS